MRSKRRLGLSLAVTMQAQVAQALSKEPEVAYVEQQVHMWFTGEQTVGS